MAGAPGTPPAVASVLMFPPVARANGRALGTQSGAKRNMLKAEGEAGVALGSRCPNCGEPRPHRFCARCGQSDRSYIRSLPLMTWEFLRETFELDSRLLRTLRTMALRPGELPAEFSRNRRASYSSPVRLYLFASIAFFFVLSLTAEFDGPEPERMQAVRERALAAEADANVPALRAWLPPAQTAKLDEMLSRPEYPGVRLFLLETAGEIAAPEPAEEMNAFVRFALAQVVDVLYRPSLALDRLVDNLPISMFFMLPAYALLLQLFYRRKQRYYVEHLMFGVHIHIVAFMAFTALLLVPENAVGDTLGGLLTLCLLAYYYLALRRYYGDGRTLTAAKWFGLMATYTAMLAPGLLLAMFATLYSL